MKQPSPTSHGFNPDTKEWETEEGKENYRKEVAAYAKYVSFNQPKYATVNISGNASKETIEALEEAAKFAYRNSL